MPLLPFGSAPGVTSFDGRKGKVELELSDLSQLFSTFAQLITADNTGAAVLLDRPAVANYVLMQDDAGSVGIAWRSFGAIFGGPGQLFVGTGANAGEVFAPGSTGQVLTVGGSDLSGLEWAAVPAPTLAQIEALFTAIGQLLLGTGSGTGTLLGIGTTGQVLTVVGGTAAWATPAAAPVSSVFGRTGAVTATTGDYTAAQVTNAMSTATYDPAAIAQQVVGTTATQTLTNKTLTSPIISSISNTGTLTLPTSTDTLVGRATTDTLTNKRITKRVSTTSGPGATPSMDTDNYDLFQFTSLAAAITSMTTNLTGTPNAGDLLWIQFRDNGTARAITWGSKFAASGTVPLPTTTVASTTLNVGFVYDTTQATPIWSCVAVA
jgi:hypothetical protein